MIRVTIGPLNLRDFTYLGANMRDEDRREIMCQVPEGITGSQAAAAMFPALAPDWSWLASYNGNPAAAFGFQPFNVACWCAWMWGSPHLPRCIPEITRHIAAAVPVLLNAGCRRVEVRTIKGHDLSHRWLGSMGAQYVCDTPEFGRDGETFEIWQWVITGPRPRSNQHVLQRKNAARPGPSAAADAAGRHPEH